MSLALTLSDQVTVLDISLGPFRAAHNAGVGVASVIWCR